MQSKTGLCVFFCMLVGVGLMAVMSAQAQTTFAPSASMPPQPQATPVPDRPPLNQQVVRSIPTLDEESAATVEAFRKALAGKKPPRVMVLLNRDMENNDHRTMEVAQKVTEAGSLSAKSSKEGTLKVRAESVSKVYVPKGSAANDFSEDELVSIQNAFEQPFIEGGAALVDRDVAVSLSGIDVESVFADTDLPEAQQGQVAGVKKHADIIITAHVKRGTSVVQKVSGDYTVQVPRIIAKAISLSDGRIMASASTEEVKAGTSTEVTVRVALLLMSRMR